MPLLSIRVSQWESFRAWGTLPAIDAHNRKSGELRRILRVFEPRSGEGHISGRDAGTKIAQQSEDRVARRSVSGVGIPLKWVGRRPGV